MATKNSKFQWTKEHQDVLLQAIIDHGKLKPHKGQDFGMVAWSQVERALNGKGLPGLDPLQQEWTRVKKRRLQPELARLQNSGVQLPEDLSEKLARVAGLSASGAADGDAATNGGQHVRSFVAINSRPAANSGAVANAQHDDMEVDDEAVPAANAGASVKSSVAIDSGPAANSGSVLNARNDDMEVDDDAVSANGGQSAGGEAPNVLALFEPQSAEAHSAARRHEEQCQGYLKHARTLTKEEFFGLYLDELEARNWAAAKYEKELGEDQVMDRLYKAAKGAKAE
ncbi:hypothetical protein F5Y15DRAFT_305073 [Xylariaceae sp. FL0016]|nr:hypothetical protein F5Y15DRAFT_305073 [Xylariaceae sp. FL0016]